MEQDVIDRETDESYQCTVCGEEFDSKEALEKHVRRAGLLE